MCVAHGSLPAEQDKRLDAETALRHPYFAQFHNPADEPVMSKNITIALDDNKRLTLQVS